MAALTRPPAIDRLVATGRTDSVLSAIMQADVELSLWERKRPCALNWLDAIDWDEIDDIEFTTDVARLPAKIDEALTDAGYPTGADHAALHQEITSLATRFASIMAADQLSLRLEVVETDACRKFHADMVTARLLTTLVGPATQWIKVGSPGYVHQLNLGDVAIFKGRILTETPAILHRSPPIIASGETRLLLVINPVGADHVRTLPCSGSYA